MSFSLNRASSTITESFIGDLFTKHEKLRLNFECRKIILGKIKLTNSKSTERKWLKPSVNENVTLVVDDLKKWKLRRIN